MDDAELEGIADAWFAYTEAEKKSPAREENWWAVEQVLEWSGKSAGDAEKLWRFILAAYGREMSDAAMASLAAGPLEDLLAHHGPAYIGRVEELARSEPRFNLLLGGVWRNAMTEDVWRRVQAARLRVW